jgi:two-component system nitrate/nitrite response regulator NarL
MDDASRTRVALLSYNPSLAVWLRSALGRSPAFEPATWSNDLDEFAARLADKRPDIALLDVAIGLPLVALRDLRNRAGDVRIVLWGNPTVEFGFHAMEMGIRGIMPAATAIESFPVALSSIRVGHLWFEKNLVERFLLARRVSLTPREGHLIGQLAKGLKNRELAYALGITEGSVKVYLSRLFGKLGVNDRFELALHAQKNVVVGQSGARMGLSDPSVIATLLTRSPKKKSVSIHKRTPDQLVSAFGHRVSKVQRCKCGQCPSCMEEARWERIYQEKFADPGYYSRQFSPCGSSLSRLPWRKRS